MSATRWRSREETFGVNVRGTLFTVQKALPLLNDGASVILNSSVRADDGVAAFGTYAAAKAAIRSFAPDEVADVVAFLVSGPRCFSRPSAPTPPAP
jgi:NADP-dependent 3-hydroxy acid dehydrogenase YdfG